jgi:hypothetical protein
MLIVLVVLLQVLTLAFGVSADVYGPANAHVEPRLVSKRQLPAANWGPNVTLGKQHPNTSPSL